MPILFGRLIVIGEEKDKLLKFEVGYSKVISFSTKFSYIQKYPQPVSEENITEKN
jgi:hypothetical protein